LKEKDWEIFKIKLHHLFINCSHSMTEKTSIWSKPMKGSQPNTVITVLWKTFLQ